MFNYNHLFYFYITAREGGVIPAADFLKISQPSLSSQLKVLERSVGKKLFLKVGRKLELSADGQATYSLCKRMFEVSELLSQTLEMAPGLAKTALNFAVSDEIERPFAATYLSHLFKSLSVPNINQMSIKMVSSHHAVLVEELLKSRFDFLITNYSTDERQFLTLSDVKMPVHCFYSPKSVVKIDSSRTLSSTTKQFVDFLARNKPPLILPTSNQKLRQEINYFLEQNSLILPVVFETNVVAAAIRSTVEGNGITFLPSSYVEREVKIRQLRKLTSKPLWSHNLNLVCRPHLKDDPISHQAKASFERMILGFG